MSYQRQAASADRMINKKGATVKFVSVPTVLVDPNKPWEPSSGVAVETNLKMVFLSPSSSGDSQLGKELLQFMQGTEVVTGQIRGYMGALGITPKISDKVIRDSKTLIIKAVDTLKPADIAILHIVEFEL